MIKKNMNFYIAPKTLGTALLALVSGVIGFILGHTPALHWLTNHMTEGFGALLSGLIGFTGLIFVAWWSGRQNSYAITQSAMLDRELQELKRHEEGLKKAAYLVLTLKDIRIHVSEVKEMMKEFFANKETEEQAAERLNWIRKNILPTGVLDPPAIINEPEFIINIGVAAMESSTKINSFLKVIRIGLQTTDEIASRQAENLLDSCNKCIIVIDATINHYEPDIPWVDHDIVGKTQSK